MEKALGSYFGDASLHATTILAVKKDGVVAMAGDGQVTLGQNMIMKHTARKLRRVRALRRLSPRERALREPGALEQANALWGAAFEELRRILFYRRGSAERSKR